MESSLKQRSGSVGHLGLDIGAILKQELDNGDESPRRRFVKRRGTGVVSSVEIGTNSVESLRKGNK